MNFLRVNFYTYVMGLGIVDAILVEKNMPKTTIKNKKTNQLNYGNYYGASGKGRISNPRLIEYIVQPLKFERKQNE